MSDSVYYLGLDVHGDPAVNVATGRPYGWGVSVGQSASAALPEPRADHTTFTNSAPSTSSAASMPTARRPRPTIGPSRARPTARSAPGSTSTRSTCPAARRRRGGDRRPERLPRRWHRIGRGGADFDRARRSRPACPVLPGRAVRADHPGAIDQGRDRPAAGLHRRRLGRAGDLVILILIGWAFSHARRPTASCSGSPAAASAPHPRTSTRPSPRSARSAADAHRSRWWSRATRRCRPRPTASTARLAGR